MRKQDQKNLVKSGIFVSCMIAVFMVFTVTIGKESSWLVPKSHLKAIVPSAQGLKNGAVVEFKGIKIGTVDKIKVLSTTEIGLDLIIQEKFLKFIKMDSKVAINTKGLVGDKLLEIVNGTEEEESVKENSVLFATSTVTMDKVMQKGEKLADTAARVLTKMDIFLDQMIADNKVEATFKELKEASSELKKFTQDMNKTKVLHKMDALMTRMVEGPGTMHSLIYQDTLYNQMEKILGGANRNKVLNYFIKDSLKKAEEK